MKVLKFKAYPSCFNTHAAIDCMLALGRRYSLVPGPGGEDRVHGLPPDASKSAPIPNPVPAWKPSSACSSALPQALAKGEVTLETFDDDKLDLAALGAIAPKLTLLADESFSATRSSRVAIELESGEWIEERVSLLERSQDPRNGKTGCPPQVRSHRKASNAAGKGCRSLGLGRRASRGRRHLGSAARLRCATHVLVRQGPQPLAGGSVHQADGVGPWHSMSKRLGIWLRISEYAEDRGDWRNDRSKRYAAHKTRILSTDRIGWAHDGPAHEGLGRGVGRDPPDRGAQRRRGPGLRQRSRRHPASTRGPATSCTTAWSATTPT